MKRLPLVILSIGHLAVDVTGGAVPAILPLLQAEFHLSYLLVAGIIATSNITSSIVQPVFGLASDKAAARYLLPLGVLLSVAGFAFIGLAPTYGALLVAVAVSGIGSAIYHPEASKSASYVVGQRRATGMALFSVGGNIGFALGPITIIAIVAVLGIRGTWIMAIPGIVAAAAVAAVMPAIARAHAAHEQRRAQEPGRSRPGAMTLLVSIVAARSVVYGGLLTFVPLYAVNVLHRAPGENGLLLSLLLGSGAAGTLVAAPIADRFGKRVTMLVSLALVAPLLAVYILMPGPIGIAALALSGACLIGTFTLTLLLGQDFMPNRLALASALMIGFTTGLGGLGVALLGQVADLFGLATVLWSLVGIAGAGFVLTIPLRLTEPHGSESAIPGHVAPEL